MQNNSTNVSLTKNLATTIHQESNRIILPRVLFPRMSLLRHNTLAYLFYVNRVCIDHEQIEQIPITSRFVSLKVRRERVKVTMVVCWDLIPQVKGGISTLRIRVSGVSQKLTLSPPHTSHLRNTMTMMCCHR